MKHAASVAIVLLLVTGCGGTSGPPGDPTEPTGSTSTPSREQGSEALNLVPLGQRELVRDSAGQVVGTITMNSVELDPEDCDSGDAPTNGHFLILDVTLTGEAGEGFPFISLSDWSVQASDGFVENSVTSESECYTDESRFLPDEPVARGETADGIEVLDVNPTSGYVTYRAGIAWAYP